MRLLVRIGLLARGAAFLAGVSTTAFAVVEHESSRPAFQIVSTQLLSISLGRHDIDGFVRSLEDPARMHPSILISHDPNPRDLVPAVDPQTLAERLRGAAQVHALINEETDEAVRNRIGRNFSAWGGALRLYEPQVNLSDPTDAIRHRVLTANALRNIREATEAKGADGFEALLRILNALRVK